jgi:hypothetical protein
MIGVIGQLTSCKSNTVFGRRGWGSRSDGEAEEEREGWGSEWNPCVPDIVFLTSKNEILLEQRRDLKYTGSVENAQLKNAVSLILFGWKEGKRKEGEDRTIILPLFPDLNGSNYDDKIDKSCFS